MVTTTPLALAISVHIRYLSFLIHPINIYNAIRTHLSLIHISEPTRPY